MAGCGAGSGSPESAPAASGTAGAEVGADDPAPCGRYARRLCETVGPRSETCGSALGVLALMSPRACLVGIEDWELTVERIASLRKDCEQLADQVCAELGEDTDGCRALRHDVPSIPPGHCPSLLREAPKLIAQVRERERMSAPLDAVMWAAVSSGGGPEFGKADAKVVLVEFSDFQCPYCARAAEAVAKVKAEYGERVRFVFRQFPLSFHEHAQGAAQASLAAHEQGKFWEFHDLLFANQGSLGTEALEGYAKQLGLDMAKFKAASSGDSTATLVKGDLELGMGVFVRGTPTLFINGKRVENSLEYESVAEAIDSALAEAE